MGVVADEKVNSLDNTSAGVYVSYAQSPIVGVSLLVKGASSASALIGTVQRAIWALNKNQALPNPTQLEQIKSDSLGQTRLRTLLLAAFALLALLMAAVGVYGVLSYVTAQRTTELGVRAALGASASDLVRLVVRGGTTPVAARARDRGLRGDRPDALAPDPALRSGSHGPGHDGGAGAVLLLVAWAACYVPARRASRVDPMRALRIE